MSQDARLDEEQATLRRARIIGMNYVDTSKITDKVLYKDLLSVSDLQLLRLIPLRADEHNIIFGVTTTTSQQTMAAIRNRFLDQTVSFSIISETGFTDYMRLYNPPAQIKYQDIKLNNIDSSSLVEQISSLLQQVKADDMLAYLVEQAHRLNASDIHIETQGVDVRIRFRIDGVLHPIAKLFLDKYRVLIAAIASAGNISTSSDEAQQGHIAQKVVMADGRKVDVNVRLETIQTINGMDVVMRLFNMTADMYTLERLGLSDKERAAVDDIIARPSGLVMVVGPTGSGKTTTLYSMLNTLNVDTRKIITIEDPVEYQFSGITQISVKAKLGAEQTNFADKLRAVLRLDPDIVMVGEIRDMDTARTALQAALTGHLVLTTFHASSAAAALTRLGDIIGKNPLFVSAIRLVMAQRLIRKLDDEIKEAYSPSESELQLITRVLMTLPADTPRPNIDGLQLYKPGHSTDNPFGYKGQFAIREQFTMTSQLRALLEKPETVLSTQSIEAAATASGMHTMLQDGILKVIAGQTTMDEIFRVVG